MKFCSLLDASLIRLIEIIFQQRLRKFSGGNSGEREKSRTFIEI